MSVIVRDEEGKLLLLCKGADRLVGFSLNLRNQRYIILVCFSLFYVIDLLLNHRSFVPYSVMFERLAKNGREYEEKTREHVNEYADAGLRTLILAYRELSEEEFQVFDSKLLAAKNSVSADREAMIDDLTENIEKDLILLGATAVEDKLQKGVSYEIIIN